MSYWENRSTKMAQPLGNKTISKRKIFEMSGKMKKEQNESGVITDLQLNQEAVLSLKGCGYTNMQPSVSYHITAKATVLSVLTWCNSACSFPSFPLMMWRLIGHFLNPALQQMW